MVNCPLNDMLARLRNAFVKKKLTTKVLKTKFNLKICLFLLSRGLFSFLDASNPFFIIIGLKYFNNKSLISRIVQISRPSFRPHLSFRKIRRRYGDSSLLVVSTKKGLQMKEFLFTNRIGGLVLFEIYF